MTEEENDSPNTPNKQRRWGSTQVRQPDDEATNLWGATELITEEEWQDLEERFPTSLPDMAKSMDLPVGAAIWRARAALPGQEAYAGRLPLDEATLELLGQSVRGQGGHQSFVRHLQKALEGSTLVLTRRDFNRLREYQISVGGGFGKIYQALIDQCQRSITSCGGVSKFFRPQAGGKVSQDGE